METFKTGRVYDTEQVLEFAPATKPEYATWIEAEKGTFFEDKSRHIKGFIPAICKTGPEVLAQYDAGNYF